MERALLITFGGAIGTLLRYLVSLLAAHWLGTEFPYGTLIVNVSGAFVIGLVQPAMLAAFVAENRIGAALSPSTIRRVIASRGWMYLAAVAILYAAGFVTVLGMIALVMGGLTTYSAFSYETVRLMEAGSWNQAWVNILVTTVICLSLCFLGMGVGRMLVTPR